jgi:hypothetical protein
MLPVDHAGIRTPQNCIAAVTVLDIGPFDDQKLLGPMDSTIEPQAGQKGASTIHQPLSWSGKISNEAGPEGAPLGALQDGSIVYRLYCTKGNLQCLDASHNFFDAHSTCMQSPIT